MLTILWDFTAKHRLLEYLAGTHRVVVKYLSSDIAKLENTEVLNTQHIYVRYMNIWFFFKHLHSCSLYVWRNDSILYFYSWNWRNFSALTSEEISCSSRTVGGIFIIFLTCTDLVSYCSQLCYDAIYIVVAKNMNKF